MKARGHAAVTITFQPSRHTSTNRKNNSQLFQCKIQTRHHSFASSIKSLFHKLPRRTQCANQHFRIIRSNNIHHDGAKNNLFRKTSSLNNHSLIITKFSQQSSLSTSKASSINLLVEAKLTYARRGGKLPGGSQAAKPAVFQVPEEWKKASTDYGGGISHAITQETRTQGAATPEGLLLYSCGNRSKWIKLLFGIFVVQSLLSALIVQLAITAPQNNLTFWMNLGLGIMGPVLFFFCWWIVRINTKAYVKEIHAIDGGNALSVKTHTIFGNIRKPITIPVDQLQGTRKRVLNYLPFRVKGYLMPFVLEAGGTFHQKTILMRLLNTSNPTSNPPQ